MFETIFLYVLLHRVSTHSHITESVALNNMFEVFRQTFTFCDETFEKKSILSANKFVTLQMVDVLYVRVRTFIKQPHFTTRYYGTSS